MQETVHTTSVVSSALGTTSFSSYRAVCSCGWSASRERHSAIQAEADADEHRGDPSRTTGSSRREVALLAGLTGLLAYLVGFLTAALSCSDDAWVGGIVFVVIGSAATATAIAAAIRGFAGLAIGLVLALALPVGIGVAAAVVNLNHCPLDLFISAFSLTVH